MRNRYIVFILMALPAVAFAGCRRIPKTPRRSILKAA